MDLIKEFLSKRGIHFKSKEKKKPTFLQEIRSNPENFKLEAEIVDGEVVVKIKKKEP